MGKLGDIATILGLGIVGYVIYMFATGKWKFPELKFPELKFPEIKFDMPSLTLPDTITDALSKISFGAVPAEEQPVPVAPFIAVAPIDPAAPVIENLEKLTSPYEEAEQLRAWGAWLVRQTTPPKEKIYFQLGGFNIPIGERIAPAYEPQPPPSLPPIVISQPYPVSAAVSDVAAMGARSTALIPVGAPAPASHIYTGTLAEYNSLPREIKQYYLPPAG